MSWYPQKNINRKKVLFFQHLLPLPFFLTLTSNIKDHLLLAMASDPLIIPVINLSVPKLIVYLIGNVLTQYPFNILYSL